MATTTNVSNSTDAVAAPVAKSTVWVSLALDLCNLAASLLGKWIGVIFPSIFFIFRLKCFRQTGSIKKLVSWNSWLPLASQPSAEVSHNWLRTRYHSQCPTDEVLDPSFLKLEKDCSFQMARGGASVALKACHLSLCLISTSLVRFFDFFYSYKYYCLLLMSE